MHGGDATRMKCEISATFWRLAQSRASNHESSGCFARGAKFHLGQYERGRVHWRKRILRATLIGVVLFIVLNRLRVGLAALHGHRPDRDAAERPAI